MAIEIKADTKYPVIKINAVEDGKIKGDYTLLIFGDLVGCCIDSYESGRGIPRMMLTKATEELQKMADLKRKVINHEPVLNDRSESRLAHILTDLGYKKIDEKTYSRIYSPKIDINKK